MKATALVVLASLLLGAGALVSCSQARTDAAILADVQGIIHQNAALQSEAINVQCNSGVVVLSGTVGTDAARVAAEKAARQAEGVNGVINNLQIATAAAPPPMAPAIAQGKAPPSQASPARMPRRNPAPAPVTAAPMQPRPGQEAAVPPTELVPPRTSQAVAPQPAPAAPVQTTVPAGTRLAVRLIDPIDTEKHKAGDTFRASINSDIAIEGKTVIPKYADATATLVSAKSAGRFAGSSSIVLVLSQIVVGEKTYDLQTGEYAQKGASRGSRTAKVVGGTAAVGAVIGAIAGGGKGAAVGAAAGAGAGTAAQALTKGEQIKLPAESIVEFELQAPVTITIES
ncbi:MAG: BON domain-containing protein [Acidobacteriota bacterium]